MSLLRVVLPALLLSTVVAGFNPTSAYAYGIWFKCSEGKAKAEGRTQWIGDGVDTVGQRIDDLEDKYCVAPKKKDPAEEARLQREREAKEKRELAERQAKEKREQAERQAQEKREQAERAKREHEEKAFAARTEWAQARMNESVKTQIGQALKESGISAPATQPNAACKWMPRRQTAFRGADTEQDARSYLSGRSFAGACLGGGSATLEGIKCTKSTGFHPVLANGKTDWNTPGQVRHDCEAIYVCERGALDCGPSKPSEASRQ